MVALLQCASGREHKRITRFAVTDRRDETVRRHDARIDATHVQLAAPPTDESTQPRVRAEPIGENLRTTSVRVAVDDDDRGAQREAAVPAGR